MSRAECALLTVSVHSSYPHRKPRVTLNIHPTSAHMATLTRTPNKTFSLDERTKSNIRKNGKYGSSSGRAAAAAGLFYFIFFMILMCFLCRRNLSQPLNTPFSGTKIEFSCYAKQLKGEIIIHTMGLTPYSHYFEFKEFSIFERFS